MMRNNEEYKIAKHISEYLKLQYPYVLFHFDLAGLNLSRAQAGMTKAIQGRRGYPDLFIAQSTEKYHGLFLELKTQSPYLKDNVMLKADEHLREQAAMHEKLKRAGYYACFAVGIDEAIGAIKSYLMGEKMYL